ncbi:hypothetical protein F5878DRAFT_629399 [Lentinula raphanica]|uniref:Uncharacterized protein n=1 Tax=Lentinula raphanica TaxID=153919 RepID=A0AA38UEC2_9AGAR|nr:hypothetical protein F5878DRAFT_629399 [Lentinula raphanica]
MCLQPLLPNELLHYIIEYIAYIPKLSQVREVGDIAPNCPLECPSPELLALSVTDWQLRRICLSFLFEKIRIRHDKDAKKLEEHLAFCAKFTKSLALSRSGDLTEVGEQIVSRILPQLEQLLNVKLGGCSRRSGLLRTMLAQPTVTSVLVDGVPDVSMDDHDLSKVILDRSISLTISPFLPTFKQYSDRGMRLKCLSLTYPSLDNRLQTLNLPGLEAIEIFMGSVSISFSWLSRVLSTHSTLNELWLFRVDPDHLIHNAPPFLSSLVEVIRQEGLRDPLVIMDVGLRRAKPIGPSSQEWHVTELNLRTGHSLIEQLSFLASSFPKLEILSLDLERHEGMYDIGDLCSAFALFSSLRVVYLEDILDRLPFGSEVQNLLIRGVAYELQVHAQTEVLAFTSCLAKHVRTLDSVHIVDAGYDRDNDGIDIQIWSFKGWLHVLNSDRLVSDTFA